MNKPLGKILIAGGILLALFVVGRAYYYSPSKEATQEIEIANEALVTNGSVLGASTEPDDSTDDESPAPLNNSLPSRLSIPKIDVDAHVEHLGITANGNMAAPDGFKNVSWYKYGPTPGTTGSAVMAGHDNGRFVAGVFRNLHNLQVGDDVYVTGTNGEKLRFRVVEKRIYPYDEAPLERIFGRNDKARLNLITCTGEWIPELKMSNQRLVIYTELVK